MHNKKGGVKRNSSSVLALWHHNLLHASIYLSLTLVLYCTCRGRWRWRRTLMPVRDFIVTVGNDLENQVVLGQSFPGAFHNPQFQHLLFSALPRHPKRWADSWRMIMVSQSEVERSLIFYLPIKIYSCSLLSREGGFYCWTVASRLSFVNWKMLLQRNGSHFQIIIPLLSLSLIKIFIGFIFSFCFVLFLFHFLMTG